MKFSWTGEIDACIDRKYSAVCTHLEAAINQAQSASTLSESSIEIHFCPIVMSADSLQFYPARSKISRASNVFHCSPQLNYDLFLRGTFADRLNNCLDELDASSDYLRRLDMTDQQLSDFKLLISNIRPLDNS